jgi:hypothetical protein
VSRVVPATVTESAAKWTCYLVPFIGLRDGRMIGRLMALREGEIERQVRGSLDRFDALMGAIHEDAEVAAVLRADVDEVRASMMRVVLAAALCSVRAALTLDENEFAAIERQVPNVTWDRLADVGSLLRDAAARLDRRQA